MFDILPISTDFCMVSVIQSVLFWLGMCANVPYLAKDVPSFALFLQEQRSLSVSLLPYLVI